MFGLFDSFDKTKTKTHLKLAINRIALLRNKKLQIVDRQRREIATLLEQKKTELARVKVEHVIREQGISEGIDVLSAMCDLLLARFPLVERQNAKEPCVPDIKEIVCTIIWAAPRADVQELLVVAKQLSLKYGPNLATEAGANVGGCVNDRMKIMFSSEIDDKTLLVAYIQQIYYNLNYRTPSFNEVQKTLTSIATAFNVDWKEEQLLPTEVHGYDARSIPTAPSFDPIPPHLEPPPPAPTPAPAAAAAPAAPPAVNPALVGGFNPHAAPPPAAPHAPGGNYNGAATNVGGGGGGMPLAPGGPPAPNAPVIPGVPPQAARVTPVVAPVLPPGVPHESAPPYPGGPPLPLPDDPPPPYTSPRHHVLAPGYKVLADVSGGEAAAGSRPLGGNAGEASVAWPSAPSASHQADQEWHMPQGPPTKHRQSNPQDPPPQPSSPVPPPPPPPQNPELADPIGGLLSLPPPPRGDDGAFIAGGRYWYQAEGGKFAEVTFVGVDHSFKPPKCVIDLGGGITEAVDRERIFDVHPRDSGHAAALPDFDDLERRLAALKGV